MAFKINPSYRAAAVGVASAALLVGAFSLGAGRGGGSVGRTGVDGAAARRRLQGALVARADQVRGAAATADDNGGDDRDNQIFHDRPSLADPGGLLRRRSGGVSG